MEKQLKITCLVENTAMLSSTLWGEHGLSFLVERGDARVLFDTGQSGAVLSHNLTELKLDLHDLSAIVLSHGHYDHTGGLSTALELFGRVAVYAHPDVFSKRYSRRGDKLVAAGSRLTREEIEERADLDLASEVTAVATGVWMTGEIPRRLGGETRSSRLVVKSGDELVLDPFRDDLSLVVETNGGIAVILGCCHAGILNTLAHVREHFNQPIRALIGGSHLAKADDELLGKVAAAVRDEYDIAELYLGHCTGWRSLLFLATALGDRVKPCPAGTVVEFS